MLLVGGAWFGTVITTVRMYQSALASDRSADSSSVARNTVDLGSPALANPVVHSDSASNPGHQM